MLRSINESGLKTIFSNLPFNGKMSMNHFLSFMGLKRQWLFNYRCYWPYETIIGNIFSLWDPPGQKKKHFPEIQIFEKWLFWPPLETIKMRWPVSLSKPSTAQLRPHPYWASKHSMSSPPYIFDPTTNRVKALRMHGIPCELVR